MTLGWREWEDRARARVQAIGSKARRRSAEAKRQAEEAETLLRNAAATLQTQAARIAELERASAEIPRDLRTAIVAFAPHDRPMLKSAIEEWASPDTAARREKAEAVERRLAEVASVWFSGEHTENDCTRMLCRNLWMLGPDLQSQGHIFFDKGQHTIAEAYFPGDSYATTPKFSNGMNRPDAAGLFFRQTEIARPGERGAPVFVVIEAKAPRRPVTQMTMDEAFQYALNLRRLSRTIAKLDLECLAIGGWTEADVRPQSFRIGSTHHTITVTPLTWRAVYERARKFDPASVDLTEAAINDGPPDLRALLGPDRAEPPPADEPVVEAAVPGGGQ
jgi:hypothetical protein